MLPLHSLKNDDSICASEMRMQKQWLAFHMSAVYIFKKIAFMCLSQHVLITY